MKGGSWLLHSTVESRWICLDTDKGNGYNGDFSRCVHINHFVTALYVYNMLYNDYLKTDLKAGCEDTFRAPDGANFLEARRDFGYPAV